MTSRVHNAKDLRLNDINRLVHEPSRLMILANLFRVDNAGFTFLMSQTGLNWGNPFLPYAAVYPGELEGVGGGIETPDLTG